MQFNLHPKVRFVLYVLSTLSGIWLIVFDGSLSPQVLKAIGATAAFAGLLAGYNVNPTSKQ
jgi:hypothetical protein